MPVFSVQLPDQRVLDIEAADQATALQGAQEWHQANPTPVSAEGLGKQYGVGIGRALIGNAGLAGDLGSLIQSGMEKIGIPENVRQAAANAVPAAVRYLPGSHDIQKYVEGFTGPFRQPQNAAEGYAQTLGEFTPGAAGGVAGLGRRIATNVVAPALGSETAANAADALDLPQLKPYLRVLGGLGAGLTADKIAGSFARSAATNAVPTAQELKDAAQGGYAQARGLGVEIDPLATGILGKRIQGSLEDAGYRDYLAPKTFRALKELETPAGPNATIADVDGVRRALNKAAADPAERDAARRALNAVDDYLTGLTPSQVLKGDATRAASILTEARGNYAAAKRSEQIGKAQEKADLQASSAGSGGNIDNATRQQFKSILNNDKKSRGYTPDELDAMRQIVAGTAGGNAARRLGKLAPTGIVSGSLSSGVGAGLGSIFGPIGAAIGAVTVPAIGSVFKRAADASTRGQVSNLDTMVRTRSPLYSSMTSPLTPASIPGTYINNVRFNPALPASRSQMSEALRNTPPWMRQILLNSLMTRPELPAPIGAQQPR